MTVTPLRDSVEPGPALENVEAEQALLGAIFMNNAVYARVSDLIRPEHFANTLHGRIFAEIGELIGRGDDAQPVTLKDALKGDAAFIEAGGAGYLGALKAGTVSILNCEHYGRRIVRLAQARAIAEFGQKLVDDAQTIDPDQILADIADRLRAVEEISPRAASGSFCTLRLGAWLERELPEPDFLLGELLSTTSRMMLAAASGIGKTNFGVAVALGIATGDGFLRWRGAGRPIRVLYIDGEMSKRLLRARLGGAVRRAGAMPPTLHVLCRDDVDDMPPLNTRDGQRFIDRVVAAVGGVDFIVFDNIQSLLLGDMKDEEPWQEVLPWARDLTRRSIGQLWVHHTGHDRTRYYGTSTREWQLDTVAILEEVERPDADIAFTLKFSKARERAPHNRPDFEEVTITLADDEWQVEGAAARPSGKKPPSPKGLKFYDALTDAVASAGVVHHLSAGRAAVTLNQWLAECARLGLMTGTGDNRDRALFSKYRLELHRERRDRN